MGCPGTGRPGVGRVAPPIGTPGWTGGGTARIGALYTGLDPSVERSCAEPAAVSVAAPNSAQKQMETLPPVALVGLEPAEPDVLARQTASVALGVQQPVVQRPEAREALLPVV